MNREILFRGKRVDNGEWITGCLLKVTLRSKQVHLIFGDNFSLIGGNVKALSHAMVDPATVGQVTGLTDKNGKKVFEHDIIQFRFEGDAEPPSTPPVWYETGHVFWHEQLLGWYVAFADDPDGIPLQEYDDHEDVFVIGNSFDNPELLEGERE